MQVAFWNLSLSVTPQSQNPHCQKLNFNLFKLSIICMVSYTCYTSKCGFKPCIHHIKSYCKKNVNVREVSAHVIWPTLTWVWSQLHNGYSKYLRIQLHQGKEVEFTKYKRANMLFLHNMVKTKLAAGISPHLTANKTITTHTYIFIGSTLIVTTAKKFI